MPLSQTLSGAVIRYSGDPRIQALAVAFCFGAMGTPASALAQVTGLPMDDVAPVAGRQTPLPALVVPLVLVFLVHGARGLRETRVPALACGVVFAVAQFAASNHVSAQLADIGAPSHAHAYRPTSPYTRPC